MLQEGISLPEITKQENALREQIRAAISNPISSLEYFGNFFEGRHVPPPNRVLITGLTHPGAKRFYELVKEELVDVQTRGDVQFSHWLEDSLSPQSKEQNTFDHELSHIEQAEVLGVDLSTCSLELFFLTDGFGLQLIHQFIAPLDIDPMIKLRIALSPEEPSVGDLEVVKKYIEDNGELLKGNPELLTEISLLYSKRTGKDLVSLFE